MLTLQKTTNLQSTSPIITHFMQNIRPGSFLNNGKYRVDIAIGHGGFGITYLGEHTMLHRKVAIKEYFPRQYCDREEASSNIVAKSSASAQELERYRTKFIKEAITLSRLSHPNIVQILDVFEDNGSAYFVMDYIEGETLNDMVEKRALSLESATAYVLKIAGALGHIHEKKINHLDIKPANIIVRTSDDEPVLIDFGLAKNYDSQGNQTSATPIGVSRGYAPLEQYTGALDSFSPESDLYSLAATFYKIITQSTPPEPSTLLNTGRLDFPDNIPESIREVITKAMSVSKAGRYRTAAEFIAAIKAALVGHQPADEPQPVSAPIYDSNDIATPAPEIPQEPATEYEPETVADTTDSGDADLGFNFSIDIDEPEDSVSLPVPGKEEEPQQQPTKEPASVGIGPEGEADTAIEPSTIVESTSQPQPVDVTEQYDEAPLYNTGGSLDVEPQPADSFEQEYLQESEPEPIFNENPPGRKRKKQSKSRGFIVLLALIVIAIGGAAAIFYFWTAAGSPGSSVPHQPSDTIATPASKPDSIIYVTDFKISCNENIMSYTGPLNADSLPHGKGRAIGIEGSISDYNGQFANGVIDGKGFTRFRDGSSFDGIIHDDMFIEGKFTYNDNSFFIGTYADGEMSDGYEYNADGTKAYRYVDKKRIKVKK